MKLVINEDNLKDCDVEEFSTKVRAILVGENNKILIANYYNLILLPGGKVDDGESVYAAIIRELSEELGQEYSGEELDFFVTLKYYQKNYPKADGTVQNRLAKTHYFIGPYKDIKINSQKLTEREQKGNFKLELVSLEDLENMILKNKISNPRNVYFQKELLSILEVYKRINRDIAVKKI